MPKTVLMEELHLSVTAPVGLRKAEYQAIHRPLTSARFRKRLHETVRDLFRQYPALKKTRVTITQ